MSQDDLDELERQWRADPDNIDLLIKLTTARDRSGWKIEGKPLSGWVKALNSKRRKTRIQAFRVLRKLGAEAVSAAPKLVELLSHEDETYREVAADVLGKIGKAYPKAFEPLITLLQDESEESYVRAAAATAVANFECGEINLAEILEEIVKHDGLEVPLRREALRSLAAHKLQGDHHPYELFWLLAPDDENQEILTALTAFKDELIGDCMSEAYDSHTACFLLGEFGDPDPDVLVALLRAPNDAGETDHFEVCDEALKKLGYRFPKHPREFDRFVRQIRGLYFEQDREPKI